MFAFSLTYGIQLGEARDDPALFLPAPNPFIPSDLTVDKADVDEVCYIRIDAFAQKLNIRSPRSIPL